MDRSHSFPQRAASIPRGSARPVNSVSQSPTPLRPEHMLPARIIESSVICVSCQISCIRHLPAIVLLRCSLRNAYACLEAHMHSPDNAQYRHHNF